MSHMLEDNEANAAAYREQVLRDAGDISWVKKGTKVKPKSRDFGPVEYEILSVEGHTVTVQSPDGFREQIQLSDLVDVMRPVASAILFYRTKEQYGCFSNFSRDQVIIYDRTWKTSEAPFQAMKFEGHPEIIQRVFEAVKPGDAAEIGRDRSLPLRKDWDERPTMEMMRDRILTPLTQRGVFPGPQDLQAEDGLPRRAEPLFARTKDVIMFEVVLAKFTQNEECRKVLLSTGDAPLIEDTESSGDSYWGWGKDHLGQNKLGRILMVIRPLVIR